ncbi:hypothetical protein FRC04_003093 [Tulasnella sp. 424]|nr:hypothetical protein FRC04_003093 [Tulasnella sp. 424]KAG8981114.1 hypothetical protein FRC05_004014 [Tulasnella sp. 425]
MLRAGLFRSVRLTPTLRPTPGFVPSLTRPASTFLRNPTTFPKASSSIQLRKPPTAFALVALQLKRGTASSVAGRPASEDLPHALQNAREEARGIGQELANIIAAANFRKSAHEYDGFSDITAGYAAEVPKPILITGLAGALPYLGTAASTLYSARVAGLLASGHAARVDFDTAMSVLEAATQVQVTYGAVLLSFLGALHWGMEFTGYGGYKGYRRLALGAAPVAFAWSTLALDPTLALVAQWVGFSAMWYADMRVTLAGWTPVWYSQYRFYLSILIGSCILTTLWAQPYLNPVIEDTMFLSDTTLPASSNTPEHLTAAGKFSGSSENLGELETVEGETYYVMLKHKADEAAEESDDGEESAKEHVESASKDQMVKHEEQKEGRGGEIKADTDSKSQAASEKV